MPKHYWFGIPGYDIKNGYVLSRLTVHDIYFYLYGPWIYKSVLCSLRGFVFLPLSNEDPNYMTHSDSSNT